MSSNKTFLEEENFMRHPFELTSAELENLELDFGELLPDEEAAQVSGGCGCYGDTIQPVDKLTTTAVGEEGGCIFPPAPEPPTVTTFAVGEEGGAFAAM